MANPRKFSEKIALHNQKQAEETAAFEAIMRDVNCVTKVCQICQTKRLIRNKIQCRLNQIIVIFGNIHMLTV